MHLVPLYHIGELDRTEVWIVRQVCHGDGGGDVPAGGAEDAPIQEELRDTGAGKETRRVKMTPARSERNISRFLK